MADGPQRPNLSTITPGARATAPQSFSPLLQTVIQETERVSPRSLSPLMRSVIEETPRSLGGGREISRIAPAVPSTTPQIIIPQQVQEPPRISTSRVLGTVARQAARLAGPAGLIAGATTVAPGTLPPELAYQGTLLEPQTQQAPQRREPERVSVSVAERAPQIQITPPITNQDFPQVPSPPISVPEPSAPVVVSPPPTPEIAAPTPPSVSQTISPTPVEVTPAPIASPTTPPSPSVPPAPQVPPTPSVPPGPATPPTLQVPPTPSVPPVPVTPPTPETPPAPTTPQAPEAPPEPATPPESITPPSPGPVPTPVPIPTPRPLPPAPPVPPVPPAGPSIPGAPMLPPVPPIIPGGGEQIEQQQIQQAPFVVILPNAKPPVVYPHVGTPQSKFTRLIEAQKNIESIKLQKQTDSLNVQQKQQAELIAAQSQQSLMPQNQLSYMTQAPVQTQETPYQFRSSTPPAVTPSPALGGT